MQNLLAAAAIGGGYVEYYWDDPGEEGDEDTAKTAYAVDYVFGITGTNVVIIGGFYQDVSQAGSIKFDPSIVPTPEVTAGQVVDRETLKAFVRGTRDSYLAALTQVGLETLLQHQDIFRQEGSPWGHEHTYFFCFTTEGYWFFNGADRSVEHQIALDLEDVNGVKFVQELIKVARAGGGFVEYHYDDPLLMGDEDTGSPKLSYAEIFEFHGHEYVIGAGLYFDLADHIPEITLSVEPASVNAGDGARTVTVTATQSSDILPVSTRLVLSLGGTATGDDYSVTGEMSITIPAEATVGSTELTFTIVNDAIDETEGETIVVTATHDRGELGSAKITVRDSAGPITASEVVDEETLKDFVEGAKARLVAINATDQLIAPFLSGTTEEGDWKHGSTFLVLLNEEGAVLFHADVTDRETLKAFVRGAVMAYVAALREHGTDRYTEILNVFRAEGGDWRHEQIYLFILNTNGEVIFHGADRSLENRNLLDREDVNGVRFVQLLIEAAQGGGGFVEFHYDDPSVTGDEDTGSPKLSYAQSFVSRRGREVVFSAGIYFDLSDHVPEITLSVDPAFVTEGGNPQTVTVTATQSSEILPVSTTISLSPSGTATDAEGRFALTISSSSRSGVSGFYQARARNADGEVVGQWNSIPLNRNRRQVLELTLGGGMRVLEVEPLAAAKAMVAVSGLAPNVPNPFNSTTVIGYHLSTSGPLVWALVDQYQEAGSYQVRWDARDQGGRQPGGRSLFCPPAFSRWGADAAAALPEEMWTAATL